MSTRPDFVADAVAAWVDRAEDRERASDGVSRYGAYLRDRPGMFSDLDPDDPEWAMGDRARFAAAAWTIARGPIMSPPLVESHPRVLGVTAGYDQDAGRGVLLTVDLVSALPAVLSKALGWEWRGWEFSSFGERWREPEVPADRPVRLALPTLTLQVSVASADLPAPGPVQPDLGDAFAAVELLTSALNSVLRPVLAALDGLAR